MQDYEHDIAISYAGEDKEIADGLRDALTVRGVNVFHAPARIVELVGEKIDRVLAHKFGAASRFVVALVSKDYSRKDWARFELDVALTEEERRGETFLLPVLLSSDHVADIPVEKIAMDLGVMCLDVVAENLADKVRIHRGNLLPQTAFERAFRRWKSDQFMPGTKEGDVFLEHPALADLDVERCEFFLNCQASSVGKYREALTKIAPEVLLKAAERQIEAKHVGGRFTLIGYIGRIDPRRAEVHLRRICEDDTLQIGDRANAFAELWKCESPGVARESRDLLLDPKAPPRMRRAAAINVLWGPLNKDTEATLAQAIADPRYEVRKIVCHAIARFRLEDLAPQLIAAYRLCRSRKGKHHLWTTLRLFNKRSDVIEFGKEEKLGPAFFEPPKYVHDWEKERGAEAWV